MSLLLRATEGPEHNRRGFLVVGPQFISPSDILARLIDTAKLALDESHYAPDPREERRAHRLQVGRRAYRRRYPAHGPAEFLVAVAT